MDTPILDLGCGTGNNSLYLFNLKYKVIAIDYSSIALNIINKYLPNIETKLVDISSTLPFKDNSFYVVIADLSLHYFSNNDTYKILKEIKRIIKPNGYLLARVNSINDINYMSNNGIELEDNYYYIDGYNKRFFSNSDAIKYFSTIGEVKIKENTMLRYSKPKEVIEIVVKIDKK